MVCLSNLGLVYDLPTLGSLNGLPTLGSLNGLPTSGVAKENPKWEHGIKKEKIHEIFLNSDKAAL